MATIIKVSNLYGTTLSPDGVETIEIHITPTIGIDTKTIQDAVDEAEASASDAAVSADRAEAEADRAEAKADLINNAGVITMGTNLIRTQEMVASVHPMY